MALTRLRVFGIFCLCLSLLCSPSQSPPNAEATTRPSPAENNLAPQGKVYYVAPSGNDSNSGSLDKPWRTIQKAANTLVAGDTVYIRAGTYHEKVTPQNSGSAGNYITYAAYPGEVVTLDGSGVALNPDDFDALFFIADREYLRVSRLRVINAGPHWLNAGILMLRTSHMIIEHNFTDNTTSSGIAAWWSSHIEIAHNTVDHACGGLYQECITVDGTDQFEIHHNQVYHCQKEGIDAKNGSSNGKIYRNLVDGALRVSIYVDAYELHTFNIEVYQNIVRNSTENDGIVVGSEMGGLLENIHIYNNLVYHNRYLGIVVAAFDQAGPVKDIYILNNTVYDNGWTDWGGGIAIDNPRAQNVVVRNNIVSQNLYFQMWIGPQAPIQEIHMDHNLIDGYRGHDSEGETRGSAYVEGDPRFVNASAANFHLRFDSPAIDAGSALNAPDRDYDGFFRPQDGDGDSVAVHDIGAFEFSPWSDQLFLPLIIRSLLFLE